MPTTFLIDVGSTIVKGVRLDASRAVANAYHTRVAGERIATQVEKVLGALAGGGAASDEIRICSSANGGLNVGLLVLSRRVSGAALLRMLEAVGANVRFHCEWREAGQYKPPSPVDLLIVAGGIDSYSDRAVRASFSALEVMHFGFDRLVYAGHSEVAHLARTRWPNADIVPNPLRDGLAPDNRAVAEYARRTYLDDIESKKELWALRTVSSVSIEPTPAIVSVAFERLLHRYPSPAILLDIGGATTDLHFMKELLDEEPLGATRLAAFPMIGRHVFTAYGVHDSRRSTIMALLNDPTCHDLLEALYGPDARSVYHGLLEGEAGSHLLFASCLFLSLRAVVDGTDDAPKLLLNTLSTLMISGGAAKGLSPTDVARTAKAALGRPIRAHVVCDPHYRWWTLGLMKPEEIGPMTFEALGG